MAADSVIVAGDDLVGLPGGEADSLRVGRHRRRQGRQRTGPYGQVGGGQGVRFTLLGGEQATLVIDPASGQIRATNFFVDNQGGEFWQQIPNATITGRWTDTLP